jgi:hypothetical protein
MMKAFEAMQRKGKLDPKELNKLGIDTNAFA